MPRATVTSLQHDFLRAADDYPARLRALCNDHPALRGRETVDFPYRTEAWVCRRDG